MQNILQSISPSISSESTRRWYGNKLLKQLPDYITTLFTKSDTFIEYRGCTFQFKKSEKESSGYPPSQVTVASHKKTQRRSLPIFPEDQAASSQSDGDGHGHGRGFRVHQEKMDTDADAGTDAGTEIESRYHTTYLRVIEVL